MREPNPGGRVFASSLLAAPMAGVTDVPFRERLRDSGCRALWTEMVSCAAILRNHRATRAMLSPPDFDPDLTLQLFGAKPDEVAHAAETAHNLGWARLDLNLGCPVRKVVATGAGSALMRAPSLAARVIGAARAGFKGILTVKIRLGWSAEEANFREIGRIAVDEGADGVILHGRTRAQGYSGRADWEAIGNLASLLPVPVAGNGDVVTAADAVDRLGRYPVAAVMIGRGALYDPSLFMRAQALLEGGSLPPPPTPAEVADDLARQFERLAELKNERVAVAEIKKFLAWADKGRVGAPARRARIMRSKERADILEELASLRAQPPLSSEEGRDFGLEAEEF